MRVRVCDSILAELMRISDQHVCSSIGAKRMARLLIETVEATDMRITACNLGQSTVMCMPAWPKRELMPFVQRFDNRLTWT